jgi:hypothetical protein
MIKNLLREELNTYKNNFDKISLIVSESFKTTDLIKNNNFITESTSLLMSDNKNKFLSYVYESAEMFDALLNICVLTFSTENSKLGGDVLTFSLPAGWTCPFAKSCMKKVDRERKMDPEKVGTFKTSKRTGEKVPYKGDVVVTKGKDSEYDCFAANQELQYDALRANRWHNFDLLKEAGDEGGSDAQAELIVKSIYYHFDTEGAKKEVRIHESGDFFNGEYLEAWIKVAQQMPNVKFYAYTKSIPYVKFAEEKLKNLPNFSITFSEGGRRDSEMGDVDIKQAKVYNTPEEILKAGLILDLDDNLAKEKGGKEKNFALLVHGTQEKGEMSQNKMRNETFMNYWKYREQLCRNLNQPTTSKISTETAQTALNYIENILSNPPKGKKIDKTHYGFLKTQLNYVVKYNKYNFNDNLTAILPEKYRP